MTRFVLSCLTSLVLGTWATAAPPAGNWKLLVPINERTATFLISLSESDGKWAGDLVDTRPGLKKEPKITTVTVAGETVSFVMTLGGKEFLSFEGTVTKDGKKMLGSLAMTGEPLRVTELMPSKLKKFDDAYAINKETFEQIEGNSPELFDIGFELVTQAGSKKVTVDEVRGVVDRLSKAAAVYGTKWDKSVALKLSGALAEQAAYADIALAQARRAERMLTDTDSTTTRLEVLDLLAKALIATKKADELKPIQTQIARVEARDYADYIKVATPFEIVPFKARKAKSDRVVLLEFYSGSEFPLSAAFEQALDGVLKAYQPTEVLALNYHIHLQVPNPLASDDAMNRFGMNQSQVERGKFCFAAGKPGPGAASLITAKEIYTGLRELTDAALELPAGAKITLTTTKGAKGVDCKAVVEGLTIAATDKFSLRFAVVEPRVRYAGASGAKYHANVVRAMLGGAKGFTIAKAPFEQTVTVEATALRETLVKYLAEIAEKQEFTNPAKPLDLKGLKVIAFVQNETTGEILTATQADVEGK